MPHSKNKQVFFNTHEQYGNDVLLLWKDYGILKHPGTKTKD